MTLRRLTIFILMPVFFATFASVWFYFKINYTNRLNEIEDAYFVKQEVMIRSSADKFLQRITIMAKDWAYWDDTYRFIQDKNSEYIKANLVPSTLSTLKCDSMLFFDDKMNLVYSLNDSELKDKAENMASIIRMNEMKVSRLSNQRINSFFIQMPETKNIYLSVFSRVSTSDMSGTPNGFFMLVMTLDHFLEYSFGDTGFSIASYEITDNLPQSEKPFSTVCTKTETISILNAFSPIINTNSALKITFSLDNSLFIFTRGMIWVTIVSMMLIFVGSAVLVTVLMDYFVMRRVRKLTSEFREIKISPDADRLLPEDGTKELTTLAKTANSALEDIRGLNRKLLMMTNIDGLTGIPNRRFFDSSFDKEFKRAVRSSLEISAIMIDIDYFKRFNDSFGHLNGDECLKTVAEIISKSLQRPGDFAARMGGEEFIVILPETGKEGAKYIAETIRKSVENKPITLLDKRVIHVTVSLGISTVIPDHNTSKESLVEKADLAMYTAKRTRNCTKQFCEDVQEV